MAFLNTWLIPNDTRQPTETLPDLATDRDRWDKTFARVPAPVTPAEREELLGLRDELRADVEERGWGRLDTWLQRSPLRARVQEGHLVHRGADTPTGEVLKLAVELVAQGRWTRVRACPDCRWVFYDQSRNNSRVWCSMYAGETGRACGSIAKVKEMRSRSAG